MRFAARVRIMVRSIFAMALCAFVIVSAQENVRIYGFMDGGVSVSNSQHSFPKQFLGQDEIDFSLDHINLYFDWKPNPRVSTLVEVNLVGSKRHTTNSQPMGPVLITYEGNPISNEQFVQMFSQLTQSQLQALGLSDAMIAAQLELIANDVPGVLNQIRYMGGSREMPVEETTENREISVERAYFDFQLNDQFKLRFGQFITPAGIWNVDHGSPVVLTVRQPIQTTMTQIFPESQLGFMVHGRNFLGDHDLDYAIYASSGRDGVSQDMFSRTDNSTDGLEDLSYGGRVAIKLDMLNGITFGLSGLTGNLRNKYLRIQPSLDAVEIMQIMGSSTLSSEQKMTALSQLDPASLELTNNFLYQEREYIGGADLKLDIANLTLQGEVNYRYKENIREGASGMGEVLGWYALVAYRQPLGANYALTPYSMFERVMFDNAGLETFTDIGLEGFNTLIIGLNLSIYTNVRFKLEWDHFQFLRDPNSTQIPAVISDKDLSANLISTQFSVSF